VSRFHDSGLTILFGMQLERTRGDGKWVTPSWRLFLQGGVVTDLNKMIERRNYFRSYAPQRLIVVRHCNRDARSAKLQSLAFFLFFSAQCMVASFGQEIFAPSATPTPTPTSGESVQPGVNTNGTFSPIVVVGREDSMIGIAGSASEGTVGQDEISERPILRPGEVMETIPGMIVTQHAGGGKANQYFLRGFNLDHGTDFATYFDGVPINLPTHAHGEGYTDLNFLIPELIQKLDYAKGPYYAQYGDFASAGAADIQYVDRLPQNMALTTIGQYGYYRGLLAMSHTFGENDFYGYNGQDRVVSSVNPGTILGAIEAFHDDGPWDPPQNFRKLNFVLRYVRGDFYTAAVTDKLGGPNGGTASSFLSSPKLQMIFGPWFNTEFYLDGGFGFHSNDARGTTAVENPAAEGGGPAAKVPLLVQQRGGEVGVRSTAIPQLQTTFALWYLASNSELVFDGDTGDTVPTPASERYGIEFSNFYTPFPWLTLNADYA
jgi:hypothetical protein